MVYYNVQTRNMTRLSNATGMLSSGTRCTCAFCLMLVCCVVVFRTISRSWGTSHCYRFRWETWRVSEYAIDVTWPHSLYVSSGYSVSVTEDSTSPTVIMGWLCCLLPSNGGLRNGSQSDGWIQKSTASSQGKPHYNTLCTALLLQFAPTTLWCMCHVNRNFRTMSSVRCYYMKYRSCWRQARMPGL